jgi:hypothetical protein
MSTAILEFVVFSFDENAKTDQETGKGLVQHDIIPGVPPADREHLANLNLRPSQPLPCD